MKKDLKKIILEITELIRITEPFEEKEWFELSFNYGKWNGEEREEFGIEWVASHIFGESRDEISRQYNYFGRTPSEAVEKLLKELREER
jgi:hypothetical protein